jgi:hypothetical protein
MPLRCTSGPLAAGVDVSERGRPDRNQALGCTALVDVRPHELKRGCDKYSVTMADIMHPETRQLNVGVSAMSALCQ